MKGYHVTTRKKFDKYLKTEAILPPVRFWPNKVTAERWSKKTGRELILKIDYEYLESHPLPDHKPARWTQEIIREFEVV